METLREYQTIESAFHHFNANLFGNRLSEPMITYSRKTNARGYFAPERFSGRNEAVKCHEIALNPDVFHGQTDEEIFSTLVHEMTHLWQDENGKPSRNGYHNREWADKMDEIGLTPSSTGKKGGRRTGQKMSHFIVPGGPFSLEYAKIAHKKIVWESLNTPKVAKKSTRPKYTCPGCGANVRGKAGLNIICGECNVKMDALVSETNKNNQNSEGDE